MNIINAAFVRNGVTVRTLPVYQYDSGMILNISGLDDLPSTFRADFANTETGQSKSVIGTDGQVHVPYEYFVPGATIHCWLVWSGEDYTVTRKHIMIPIARRATPTDEEPTPEEQGVIDQAIAALNDSVTQTGQDVDAAAGYAEQAEQSAQAATDAKDTAVAAQNAAEAAKDQAVQSATAASASAQSASESAQSASQSKTDAQAAAASVAGAMDTLEATIQADLQAAKESGMFDGADGVSPTVTVTPITDGHQVMITDAEGEHTFDVTDGEDGFSPIATVTQTQTGAVISVTDKTGTATATVTNGAKGDPGTPGTDGFSPVATVTQTQTGATISITDKSGTTTAQISNGAKGDPGDDYVLTAQDKAEIAQQAAEGVDVPVQDVQVNGVSVLGQDGVAEIPVGSNSTFGVFKRGSGLYDSNGSIGVNASTDINIKQGIAGSFTTVSRQHTATFYGLAKAAGADMASSSNPVGTYTDAAKVAIQKMLGIYEAPWELIREDTFTNAEAGEYIVNVDGNGNPFELTDLVFQVTTPANEAFAINNYGAVEFYYGSNSSAYISALLNALSGPKTNVWFATVHLLNKGNAVFFWNSAFSESGSSKAMLVRNQNDFIPNNLIISKIRFKNVQGKLSYKLYGKRKWN